MITLKEDEQKPDAVQPEQLADARNGNGADMTMNKLHAKANPREHPQGSRESQGDTPTTSVRGRGEDRRVAAATTTR